MLVMFGSYRNYKDKKRLLQGSGRSNLNHRTQEEELEALKKRRPPISDVCSLVFRLLFEGGFMFSLYVVCDGFQMSLVPTWWTASSPQIQLILIAWSPRVGVKKETEERKKERRRGGREVEGAVVQRRRGVRGSSIIRRRRRRRME
ncbi:unnamed protein product [Pleuronectes platessa]|uniref:Uncharacterized protein n=1 Tax=Pleuronectes platessa TaxID=8262 RepID=A0A9N7VYP2_PLEPL|nr:unnamed protein product [Pleuronectes platessa]